MFQNKLKQHQLLTSLGEIKRSHAPRGINAVGIRLFVVYICAHFENLMGNRQAYHWHFTSRFLCPFGPMYTNLHYESFNSTTMDTTSWLSVLYSCCPLFFTHPTTLSFFALDNLDIYFDIFGWRWSSLCSLLHKNSILDCVFFRNVFILKSVSFIYLFISALFVGKNAFVSVEQCVSHWVNL